MVAGNNTGTASTTTPTTPTSTTSTTKVLAEYIWLPTASGPLPIAAEIEGQLYAIHADHRNTPRRLTNAQGTPVWQWVTTGFGEIEPSTAATAFTRERLQLATPPITGSTPLAFNLRYPGQQYDPETDLFYNHHRYYDPYLTVGYTQADPIGLEGGWNRFGYVGGGNAVNFIDPKGLQMQAFAAACGPYFGVCICAITAATTWGIVNSQPAQQSAAPWVNNPIAAAEHETYKTEAICQPPPNLSKCESLKWKLAREEFVVGAMKAWDAKWIAGRHATAIRERLTGIEKLKRQIEIECNGCEP